jgi:hypothetical protein
MSMITTQGGSGMMAIAYSYARAIMAGQKTEADVPNVGTLRADVHQLLVEWGYFDTQATETGDGASL